eukprot:1992864-Karenia_brevis.AAC.1
MHDERCFEADHVSLQAPGCWPMHDERSKEADHVSQQPSHFHCTEARVALVQEWPHLHCGA